MFSIIPTSLRVLLASLLWLQSDPEPALQFSLRHSHAISNNSRIIFTDVPEQIISSLGAYHIQTRPIISHIPTSLQQLSSTRLRSLHTLQSEPLSWHRRSIPSPDVTKRNVLLQLAKMTSNSYYEPGNKGWYDLGPNWNTSFSYGWDPDADGFRGHVFVSTDESTVVISIKGTSVPFLPGGGGPTTGSDKKNDNLLFSCCCARVGPTWSTVCPCYQGGYKCDLSCVETSLIEESLFYHVGTNLYNNISYMYPESDIWIIGHSLGGSLAALLGSTFGSPAVAFEGPGDLMAARRLHLPSPPSLDHVVHVFHTGDPIPLGQCTGVSSTCATAGYALEAQCHQGRIIRYDTVKKWGWSSNVRNHGISVIIDSLLSKDWEVEDKEKGVKGKEVPEPQYEDEECTDCFKWEIS